MRNELIQWLKDGDEISAAEILQQCEIEFMFVDLAMELSGERQIEIYDANIGAPRKILDHICGSIDQQREQIESAMREIAHSFQWHIRQVYWVPKPPFRKGPIEEDFSELLAEIDIDHVQRAWQKAIARRRDDPDGAITAARTLLESVCKFILDLHGVQYSGNEDLPKLYHMAASSISLAPDQQMNDLLRRTMGNAQAVVNSVAAIRNLYGDAHGKSAASGKSSRSARNISHWRL